MTAVVSLIRTFVDVLAAPTAGVVLVVSPPWIACAGVRAWHVDTMSVLGALCWCTGFLKHRTFVDIRTTIVSAPAVHALAQKALNARVRALSLSLTRICAAVVGIVTFTRLTTARPSWVACTRVSARDVGARCPFVALVCTQHTFVDIDT
jgi:hypothetical protein